MTIPDPFAEKLAAMTRAERLEWMERYPAVRPVDVPASWIQAAEDNYSMHGQGLLHNILSGVAPLIAAAERERIRQLAIEVDAGYDNPLPGSGDVDEAKFADLIEEDNPR